MNIGFQSPWFLIILIGLKESYHCPSGIKRDMQDMCTCQTLAWCYRAVKCIWLWVRQFNVLWWWAMIQQHSLSLGSESGPVLWGPHSRQIRRRHEMYDQLYTGVYVSLKQIDKHALPACFIQLTTTVGWCEHLVQQIKTYCEEWRPSWARQQLTFNPTEDTTKRSAAYCYVCVTAVRTRTQMTRVCQGSLKDKSMFSVNIGVSTTTASGATGPSEHFPAARERS